MKKTKIGLFQKAAFSLPLAASFLSLAFRAGAQGWSDGLEAVNDFGLPSGSIYDIISNGLMWLLGIFGFIAVIGFVISGIFYLTAAGDAEQEKKAKKAMTMSIIGVIVGLVGVVAINAINSMLSAENSIF